MTSTGKSRRTRRLLTVSVAGVAALSAAGLAGGASAGTTEPAAPETTAAASETTAAMSETTAASETTVAAAETTAAATETTAASETTAAAGTTEAGGEAPAAADLSGVCPETIVIQTDWNPEAEHGWLYELVGDDAVIDASTVRVSGSLVASGGVDTGVDIEIRSGGPAIGFQTVTSQLYADEDILLGYVYTDEGIQNAGEFPTVAIFSGMEKNPQMIMWDPATYPDVQGIADLGEQGVLIRYFGGAAYMEYFVQSGVLSADQVDGSYDGTPAAFVAADGADAQQGFGSAEPYIYENEIAEWGRPVAYEYINDAGWENYGESIATRPENLETYAECFALLVPILQQSSVDFVTDPDETNALILQAVAEFDNGWVYSEGVANYAVETMINDGLMGNGPNETLGDFDLDRVNSLIETARPVYASLGQEPPADLTAEDIVTNQFIDPSIGLPADGATEGTDAEGTDAGSETTAAATETTAGSETTMASETTAGSETTGASETTAASETTTAGTTAETTPAPETSAP